MNFSLETGDSKNEGQEPFVHYADGKIFFNLKFGEVAVGLSSVDYDKFVSMLRRAEEDDYIDGDPSHMYLLALEEKDKEDSGRNLCIYDSNMTLILWLNVKVLLNLADFLASKKNEEDFRYRPAIHFQFGS